LRFAGPTIGKNLLYVNLIISCRVKIHVTVFQSTEGFSF